MDDLSDNRGPGLRAFLMALAVVAVVVALFCLPILIGHGTIFHTHGGWPPSDETSVHLPLHVEISRQAAQGRFAVYNQWPAFGQSLAADPDALLFDPFMLVFRGAGSPSDVLSARAIVFAFFGAMAVFGFLALFGVPSPGLITAAAVYAALVLRYPPAEEVLVHYAATSWSVIGLFLAALAVRRHRWWAAPLAGLATGFSALAGHPQAAAFGFAMGVLYFFAEAVAGAGRQRRNVVFAGVGWLVVGLAVAAVQIAPLLSAIRASAHVFPDASHPEMDEDLFGYALTLLGPGIALLALTALRRRWLESGVFILTILFFLTILNTPVVRLWHAVIPFFDNFKLSSKYFVSPFPILASIGIGLAIGNVKDLRPRGRLPSKWFSRIAVAICVVAGLWVVWAAPLEIMHRLQQPAATVEALDQACVNGIRDSMPRMGRMVRFGTEALYPSLSVNARLFDVQTSASHIPSRYVALMMALNPEHADTVREDSRVMALTDPAVLKLAFWDVAGVTTLVSGRPIEVPGWELLLARPDSNCMYEQAGYWIYRNTEALPRAFVTGPDGVIDRFEAVHSASTPVPRAVPAQITRYEPDRVTVQVRGPHEGRLILSDSWSPDWTAFVDGTQVEVGRAWHIFRMVKVPAGDHEVEFRYRPKALRAGLACGAGGVLIAVVWFVTAAFARPSRRRTIRDQGSSATTDSDRQDT